MIIIMYYYPTVTATFSLLAVSLFSVVFNMLFQFMIIITGEKKQLTITACS